MLHVPLCYLSFNISKFVDATMVSGKKASNATIPNALTVKAK